MKKTKNAEITREEVINALLESKAVDFTALAKVMAQLGPRLAKSGQPGMLMGGTMRKFVAICDLETSGPMESLDALRNALPKSDD